MGSTRRTILAAGAAAAATAAVPRMFAQQAGEKGTGSFYEKGSVRIYYEEAGAGFPLMLLPGGGLNSTIAGLKSGNPFPAIEEFKGQYRCITADRSKMHSVEKARAYQVQIPNSRLVVIRSDAYHIAAANAGECVSHTLAFLKEQKI